MSPPYSPRDPRTVVWDQEAARADVYGLLAVLYYAPPSPEMLAQLRVAAPEVALAGGLLQAPWRALLGTARGLSDEAIQAEYDQLFGGLDEPEIALYGSRHLQSIAGEPALVRLRGDLATLGLVRDEPMDEAEDHFACLCEVMRYLIAGGNPVIATPVRQLAFFSRHIQPWSEPLCEAIVTHRAARFYAALAVFTRAFLHQEARGLGPPDRYQSHS